MENRPLTEVDKNIDGEIKQEVESLGVKYNDVVKIAGESETLDELESYLDHTVEDITEHLKRARQWEHKLNSHRRGLLDNQQIIEQVEDDKYRIESQINRTSEYIRSTINTLVQFRDRKELNSEYETAITTLVEELKSQHQSLQKLKDTLTEVDREVTNAGLQWLE